MIIPIRAQGAEKVARGEALKVYWFAAGTGRPSRRTKAGPRAAVAWNEEVRGSRVAQRRERLIAGSALHAFRGNNQNRSRGFGAEFEGGRSALRVDKIREIEWASGRTR